MSPTYIFDDLCKWIPPLKHNKEKLISLFLCFLSVIVLYHIGLQNNVQIMSKSNYHYNVRNYD